MARYLQEHAPTKRSARCIADFAADILRWWGQRPLSDVNARNCRAYVDWRTAQRVARHETGKRLVGTQTARNELAILRAAINYYHREHGPLQSVPAVTLPAKTPTREDYFLTRAEIAKRIRVARRNPKTPHIARLLLLGLYTGTRPGAMLKLRGCLQQTAAGSTSTMRSFTAVASRLCAPPSDSRQSASIGACFPTSVGGSAWMLHAASPMLSIMLEDLSARSALRGKVCARGPELSATIHRTSCGTRQPRCSWRLAWTWP
jgi:hypothetical protein